MYNGQKPRTLVIMKIDASVINRIPVIPLIMPEGIRANISTPIKLLKIRSRLPIFFFILLFLKFDIRS